MRMASVVFGSGMGSSGAGVENKLTCGKLLTSGKTSPSTVKRTNQAKHIRPMRDARMARGAQTRSRILTATRAVLARHGQDLTLDHVAERLGLTKQAVLYHFPSKDRLLVELALLGVAEEAEAMVAAVAPARSAAEAVRRFLRASVAFHLA